jgi:hypothetical protein
MIIRANSHWQRSVAICYPGDVLSRDTLTAALARVKGDSTFDGEVFDHFPRDKLMYSSS